MPIGEWRRPLFMERVKTSSSTGQLSGGRPPRLAQRKTAVAGGDSYGFLVDILGS